MTHKGRALLQFLICILVTALLSAEASAYDIALSESPHSIWDEASYLSTSADTEFEDVRNSREWKSSAEHSPGFGFSRQAHWLRFQLLNSGSSRETVRFFWHHTQIESAKVYYWNNSSQKVESVRELSTLTPVHEREHQGRMLDWSAGLAPYSNYTVYIRTYSEFAVSFRIQAGTGRDIEALARNTYNSVYLFMGIMLALVLYNISLAVSTGDKSYWFYCAYVSLITLYVLSLRGFLFQLGLYHTVVWEKRVVLSIAPMALVFALLFARHILQLSRMIRPVLWIYYLCMAALAIALLLAWIPSISLYIAFFPAVSLIIIIFMMVASLWRVKGGNTYALLFFFAWLSLAFGISGHQVSVFIGVRSEFLGRESLKIGTVLEAIFLSWALAARIHRMRKDHEMLRREHARSLQHINKQLARELELEQEVNTQKDELLSIISHELRTPVNMMQSSLDLMRSGKNREYFPEMVAGTERLRRNVDNLVILSEITAERLRLNYSWFGFQTLTASLHECAENICKPDQHWQLTSQINAEQMIYSDERLLTIILENLIENSFKFSPRGHIHLSVWQEESQNGDNVLFWKLEDDGLGIEKDQQNQIFRLFYQINKGRDRRSEGMGLGLPLAGRLAQKLGGHIHLSSVQHKGTTVVFSHSVGPQEIPADERPQPHSSDQAQARTALVVEDNYINAKLLATIMEKMHYQVTVVDNGAKAVEAVAAGAFSLILMDIQMPVMDGLESTRKIRASGYNGRIIAVTANDTSEDRAEAIASGMDDFLGKPIRLQQLKAKMKHLRLDTEQLY